MAAPEMEANLVEPRVALRPSFCCRRRTSDSTRLCAETTAFWACTTICARIIAVQSHRQGMTRVYGGVEGQGWGFPQRIGWGEGRPISPSGPAGTPHTPTRHEKQSIHVPSESSLIRSESNERSTRLSWQGGGVGRGGLRAATEAVQCAEPGSARRRPSHRPDGTGPAPGAGRRAGPACDASRVLAHGARRSGRPVRRDAGSGGGVQALVPPLVRDAWPPSSAPSSPPSPCSPRASPPPHFPCSHWPLTRSAVRCPPGPRTSPAPSAARQEGQERSRARRGGVYTTPPPPP